MTKKNCYPLVIITLLFAFILIGQMKVFAGDAINIPAISSEIRTQIDSFNNQSGRTFFIDAIINDKQQTQLVGVTNQPKDFLALKDLLKKKKIEFIDSVSLQPNPTLGIEIYGVITVSVANLRSRPYHSAELATQAMLGTPVNILDKTGNWLLIQTPDKYTSWIEESGLTVMNRQAINQWIAARKVVYYKNYGNSYEKADTKSQTISDVVICNVFEYISENKNFVKVMYPDKRIAFIKKNDCIDFNKWVNIPNPTPDDIIKTAKTFTGIPYLWGGTSSKGLDCSGFTKLTFLIHGIIIQRDASQQVNYGNIKENHPFDQLQPGNLLFFGEKDEKTGNESITHVAIYMNNKQFIHASGKVCYNSFDKTSAIFSQYRTDSFVKASDYISTIGTTNITKIKNSVFYNKHSQ